MIKILVPVDGSETSKNAIQAALDWSKKIGNVALDVVTVTPQLSGNVTRHVSADTVNAYYHDEGTLVLKSVADLLKTSEVPYETHILKGAVAQQIADFAERNAIDHIIMGTRGLGSVKGLVLGSVATKILSLTNIPVTMIR